MENLQIINYSDWAYIFGSGPVVTKPALNGVPKGVFAADGGANKAVELGFEPDCVIGDADSIDPELRSRLGDKKFIQRGDQDRTDFDKALEEIKHKYLIAFGFLGGRIDHSLAAYSTIAKYADRKIVLVGDGELAFLAPNSFSLSLPVGTPIGFYPLAPSKAQSTGLKWNLDGIDLDPLGMLGTSNKVAQSPISLRNVNGSLIVSLSATHIGAVLAALCP